MLLAHVEVPMPKFQRILAGMNETPMIVGLPNTEEERARRLKQEVERLAALPIVEWRYYLETGELTKKHGIEAAKLKQMVEATIHANEKKAREAKADDRRQKQKAERKQERENRLSRQEQERARKQAVRARKEAERIEREQEARRKKRDAAFAEIAELPKLTHAARLKEAAKRLDEDFKLLLEEFQVYFAARTLSDELAPWDEPVSTAELLGAIEAKFRRYAVVSDAIAAATTLWAVFAWVVEIAVHAPTKLLFTFPEKDAGKSTALGVLRWIVPRPYLAIEAHPALYFYRHLSPET
jgi:hypothetical protein